MRRVAAILAVAVGALLGSAVMASAQQSRCADCHFANPGSPGADHVSRWDSSAHSRAGVGCERCHGGNAQTFEKLPAHKGILSWADPKSPVHRANLPVTCGTCHTGQLVAFQKSRHWQLLQKGERRGPTCATCHDDVGTNLLSPKSLEGQCASCHGKGKVAPHPEFPVRARAMMQGVRDARMMLKEAQDIIRKIGDKDRREMLLREAEQVQVPLRQAIESGHAYVYDGLEERVGVAQKRLTALYARITDPGSGAKPMGSSPTARPGEKPAQPQAQKPPKGE